MIDDGDIVGEVILHDIRSPHNRMEIWKIAVAAPGKGVGRKALELAVDRCFDVHGAHRVWLDLKLYNDRARRVYEALGFVSEGIARDSYLYEGEYESLEIMSVLRPSGGASGQLSDCPMSASLSTSRHGPDSEPVALKSRKSNVRIGRRWRSA